MENTNKINSKTEQFAQFVAKCDVQAFIGVCKILKVRLDNGGKTPEDFELRPFEEVWSDAIEKFNNLGRAQRRDLAKIMKQAMSENG